MAVMAERLQVAVVMPAAEPVAAPVARHDVVHLEPVTRPAGDTAVTVALHHVPASLRPPVLPHPSAVAVGRTPPPALPEQRAPTQIAQAHVILKWQQATHATPMGMARPVHEPRGRFGRSHLDGKNGLDGPSLERHKSPTLRRTADRKVCLDHSLSVTANPPEGVRLHVSARERAILNRPACAFGPHYVRPSLTDRGEDKPKSPHPPGRSLPNRYLP